MSSTNITANQREILYARSTITGTAEYLSSTLNKLNVNATLSGSGTTIGDVRITNGTNVVDVVANDAGYNAFPTMGAMKTVSFSATGVGIIGPYTCTGYTWATVVFSNIGSGATITGQQSANGGTSFVSVPAWINSSTAASALTASGPTLSTSTINETIIVGDSFRLDLSVLGSGTVAGTIKFYSSPRSPRTFAVAAAQSGTWTVGSNSATGSAAPANAFYIGANNGTSLQGLNTLPNISADGIAGSGTLSVGPEIYNGTNWDRIRSIVNATNSIGTGIAACGLVAQLDDTAPTAITENQFGNLRIVPNRALMVETRYTYARATADTQVKGSAGFIHTISIAPTGTVTAGVLTVYDNTAESGTVIFSVSLPITTFAPFTIKLDVDTGTGIYVGFDATLANVQATVSWR